MSKFAKKKSGNEPSKEDAAIAMESIKSLQKKTDEDSELAKKLKEEEELRKKEELAEAAKVMIAQQRVKRVLRENLKKKEVEKRKNVTKNFLESIATRDSKIKWKSINNGHIVLGYVDNKIAFEIKRGLNLFSLYVKDSDLIKNCNLRKSYLSCSTNIQKLKFKSDELISNLKSNKLI